MIDEYTFCYGYESRPNEAVDNTFKVNNHKVSGDIYDKLFRKVKKNCERLTFYQALWKDYKTNIDRYNEYITFKRSIK